ncbi:DNA cytosine methyltransferase [Acinetobacter sp. SH20PTE14]|uniref:DNA cytosine methyltransferase n=1 Tax=Acinetobacter sp. SH20PTE14 TaxID=2905879 RepID=UPI001F25F28B|nr:DNA cytosine methyltransferase [Acinetobacter sp. SH20PTE14]UIJ77311.1 DNA cytosine methyltransferase [Acinetobacter sp. SH20PTE14]UIJ77314.1 DNA cytosine methyltransferase [Acinetobacter sp. SH20PTE14]
MDWLEQNNNTGGLNELALFAGAGGGILGSHLLGWNTVCAVERDAYAAQVLAQRQNDGVLPLFPIWSDVCSFDGKPWQGIIDVISGGFPCQDISSAGKGAGIDGARSGMWAEMARIIGEVRPRYVFVENSPMLVSRGLTRVISDLAKMGYDAEWARFSASNFGAPHQRDRIWIVAKRGELLSYAQLHRPEWWKQLQEGSNKEAATISNTRGIRLEEKWISCGSSEKITNLGGNCSNISNTKSIGWKQARQGEQPSSKRIGGCGQEWTRWWSIEPELGRVADGVANRVDRLKAIGNGQVSIVAKSAFEYLGGAA